MKRKLSCFLFLFVVLVTFFNVVGCKDQSVIIYTVVFNPNGGELTSNNSQKILSGDNVIVPSDPKREEYIFTGWYTESECINLYDFNNQVSGSFTLYAGWSRIEYTIIFDANGGVFSGNTSEKILSGEKVIEPALEPCNTYCSFTGWYTEPECINLYDFNTPVTSSFTLYAGWTEVYHIYINIEEGSGYMVPVPYGEKLPELEQPSIDGVYGFTGWYTEPECVNLYDFNTPVTSYFELYAGWIEPYYITIYENGYSCYMVPVLHGEKLPELKQPSPDGVYDFTGWYTEAECINLYDFNTPVTSSFTLYAGWTEVSYYTVTFNANGGWLSPYSSEYTTIGLGQTISQPSDPYSYCGIFTGWYTEPECINLYDFNSPVTSSFTLYAGWKLDDNYFSVTFNANGGTLTDVSNVIRPSSESISQPSDPIREGYYFTGWYTDVECTNKYEFNGQGINTSFTLYAGWATKPPCTVTFNANGGYFLDDYYNEISTISVTVLNGTCVAHPNNPSYQFMVFSGWYTESECKNKYDLNTPVTKNITLYAGWIPVHSINFESNGNSYFDSQHVVDGDLLICPDEIPENYGKVFTGWYTEPECTNLYNFNKPVTSSFTLYAGWGEKLIYYTITFDANGGTLTSEPTQVVLRYGKITEPINPTREGYTFTGWYDDTQCTDLIDFDYIVVDHDRTLYAGWTVTTYTVTFNANGGDLTCDTTQPVTIGNKVIHPSNPSRNEYIFTGWYTDSSCTTKYDFNSQVTSDFTLYAGWVVTTYTVTFNANGGTLSSATTQTVSSGNKIIEPTNPIRDEYIFTGWYTDINCINKYYFTNQVTSSFTLYAGWKIKTYVVSFNANGGTLTGNTSQTASSGSKITQPSNPTRNGYAFTGWYTNTSCTSLYNFNNQVTSDFTLYAGWKTLEEYIPYIFNSLEGEGPHDIVFNGEFTEEIMNLVITEIKDSNVKINLDLRNTTGLKWLEGFKGCKSLLSIEIPTSVKWIYSAAFEGCTSLLSIEIPTSVTSIDSAAFEGCTSLASIEIPTSVTSIDSRTFGGCTSLTSIEIPTSVKSIGSAAFEGCTSLKSIKIPTSVKSISDSAFKGCKSLLSIEIPSVTSIGSAAFEGCTSLKSIKIPTSVKSISDSAFEGCTSLLSIEIPTSVTSIGSAAFEGCTSLKSIKIPTSVNSISDSAFRGCTSLLSIEIPTSITSIGAYAFQNCTSLTSIEIPTYVGSIDFWAFKGCTGLTSIIFKDTTTWYYKTTTNNLGGTEISVSSPSTNATNLTSTYADYFWYKM